MIDKLVKKKINKPLKWVIHFFYNYVCNSHIRMKSQSKHLIVKVDQIVDI